jgi:hypothetical protein
MYDLTMRIQDINDLVLAETEYWGQTPGLVVVDNVANLVDEMSYEKFRSAFIGLQKVARLRGTVVVALHHVKRDSSSGRLSLHSGSYAGEQESEVVLGLWRPGGWRPQKQERGRGPYWEPFVSYASVSPVV